jgi:hypothetical protein
LASLLVTTTSNRTVDFYSADSYRLEKRLSNASYTMARLMWLEIANFFKIGFVAKRMLRAPSV